MRSKSIDVTENTQEVADFVRGLGRITKPIDIKLEGEVVGRIVPPGELSDGEKEAILHRGWELVQQARRRNKGVPKGVIGKTVDTAVKRVRAKK